MIWDVDLGSQIRISVFYPSRISDPGVKRHCIPDPGPQHWFFKVINRVLQDLHTKLKIILNSHPKPKSSWSKFLIYTMRYRVRIWNPPQHLDTMWWTSYFLRQLICIFSQRILYRVYTLAKLGVTSALVALSKTESKNMKELIARVLNAVCKHQVSGTLLLRQKKIWFLSNFQYRTYILMDFVSHDFVNIPSRCNLIAI